MLREQSETQRIGQVVPVHAVPIEPLHDLANLLLVFVMIWAYFAYSQYLIIYAGNMALRCAIGAGEIFVVDIFFVKTLGQQCLFGGLDHVAGAADEKLGLLVPGCIFSEKSFQQTCIDTAGFTFPGDFTF